MTISTWISLAIIVAVFIYFCYQLSKLNKTSNQIKRMSTADNHDTAFVGSKMESVWNAYKDTICIVTKNNKKTNIPASIYFNTESIATNYKLNFRMLDAGSGVMVGLGLLGTFLGLTLGISGFDSSDSSNIQQSIQNLLSGMGTAFITSLVGMSLSLIFTGLEKHLRNKFHRHLDALGNKLDEMFYIDDIAVMALNQSALIEKTIDAVREEFNKKLTYINKMGETVPAGNAFREILAENEEQSKALKSFSTDLAIELNNGFDEVMSRQMQEKILPLMESVDATTKSVVEHIDKMASSVTSPVSGMVENVVENLQKGMMTVIDEFRSTVSNQATSQFENLAVQLDAAARTMGNFPKSMEQVSSFIQTSLGEMKNTVSEISSASANANETALRQMQEQIALATDSLSKAVAEVSSVMDGIKHSSQEQNDQLLANISEATAKMGGFLDNTIANLSSSVQGSMKSIADDVNNRHTDLLALQENVTKQIDTLLEKFKTGIAQIEEVNNSVSMTLNNFKQTQGELNASTINLRAISGDMKSATELFAQGQIDYTEKLSQLQTSSQEGIDQVTELLKNSGQMSEEYAQKFEIIKQGIGSIFTQLQNGLTEYSRTVQSTTQKYLDQYTSSLTQTTDALSSTIQQQNEVVEMLNELLAHKK